MDRRRTRVTVPGATADILLEFGGGRYRFFLPLKAEVELERLCGNTPLGVIYDELSSSVGLDKETDEPVYMIGGQARRHYARHVIRLAAQYGGEAELAGEVVKVSAIDATRLVEQHVDGCAWDETIPVAWAILRATLTGISLTKKAGRAAKPECLHRGSVIASCAQLGLDWTTASLGEFLEAVEAHNGSAQQADRPEPASPEFRAFMRGQFGRG